MLALSKVMPPLHAIGPKIDFMPTPRLLVVDDDPNVLAVLIGLLEAHGFEPESFETPQAVLDSLTTNDVGCLVTDLEMPEISGIDLQKQLRDRGNCLAVIVISGQADVPRAIEVMTQGAVTLIEKPFRSHQLVAEVERAMQFSRQQFARRARILDAKSAIARLSQEEIDVLSLASRGLPNKTISHELVLSQRTVDRRRQSGLAKLGVESVAEFAVLLTTSGETPPP